MKRLYNNNTIIIGLLFSLFFIVLFHHFQIIQGNTNENVPENDKEKEMKTESFDAQQPFNFYEYLVGEWDVLKSTIPIASSSSGISSISISPIYGKYFFSKENTTGNLMGRYYDNDTTTNSQGVLTNQLYIYINFEDNSKGHFLTGIDDESLATLFSFYVKHSSNSPYLSLPTSAGEWADGESHYVMQIAVPDKIIITVTPKSFAQSQEAKQPTNEDFPDDIPNSIRTFTLRRVAKPEPKTFFQQYGTWIMMGGFLIFNMYMKSQTNLASTSTTQPAPAAVGKKNQ